jgi:hypothetical protein
MKMLDIAPTQTPLIGPVSHETRGEDPCDHAGCGGRHDRSWIDLSLRNAIPWKSQGRLDETTIKDITGGIDETFLDQGRRALELRIINLNTRTPFDPIEPDTILFDAVSSIYEDNRWTIYECRVKFLEWEQVVADLDLDANEAARMLLWAGNVKLHCSDPSFLYWGYQYILTQLDAAVHPEDRAPNTNNPGLQGVVCKHLNRVLKVLPFHLGTIAKEIKRQRAERGI